MIFIENIDFSNNSIRVDVRATSGIVPPTDCMDLEIMPVIQARGITRVLAPQGVPTEPTLTQCEQPEAQFKDYWVILVDFH